MLHVVTPVYRYELLQKVYESIPKHDDIIWHIAKTTRREALTDIFIHTDPRIRLYEIDCADNDMVTKRNVVFSQIHDGYFCLLDDDTIFLPELYDIYKEYCTDDFKGMIIGDQLTLGGLAKLSASFPTENPETTMIDAGMVICHWSVLLHVKWALSSTFRDRDFWWRCSKYWGNEAVILVNRTLSVYNHFGPKIKVRKKILFINLAFDIYNPRVARGYIALADTLHFLGRVLRPR